MSMWSEKYRPNDLSQMVGNEDGRIELFRYLTAWKPSEQPCLLLGPPGTGKTTAVHAAARRLGFTVLELNASDTRTKSKLDKILSPMTENFTLERGEKMLVFLDEVDGMEGRQDYGGFEFVSDLVLKSRFPIVMAANAEEDQKIRKIAQKARVIRFKKVPPREIFVYLERVCKLENTTVSKVVLDEVIRSGKGDLRLTLNLLQAFSKTASSETVESINVPSKDESYELKGALEQIFTVNSKERRLVMLRAVHAQPRDKVRAFANSILSSSISAESRFSALESVARADMLVGQINRTQNWKLLRYLDRMLAEAIDSMQDGESISYSDDDLPWPTKLKIWNDSKVLRELEDALANQLHVSHGSIITVALPYIFLLSKKNPTFLTALVHRLNLGDSATRILTKESRSIKLG